MLWNLKVIFFFFLYKPGSKTNRMSFGGQKLSGRNQMRASGSHHSLMMPPREPPKPKDSVILGECRTPKQAWKYTPSVKNIESISAVINNPQGTSWFYIYIYIYIYIYLH